MGMCDGCDGRCCRLRVELTCFDIWRIASATGKPAGGFADAVEAKSDDYGFMAGVGAAKFVLRRGGAGWCVFFNAGSPLKCSIEAVKPMMCRAHPFSLRCGKPALNSGVMCPARNLAEASVRPETLAEWEREWKEYVRLMELWNARERPGASADGFLGFALAEAQRAGSVAWREIP
jgi:Fe-S-cluster containining protein